MTHFLFWKSPFPSRRGHVVRVDGRAEGRRIRAVFQDGQTVDVYPFALRRIDGKPLYKGIQLEMFHEQSDTGV